MRLDSDRPSSRAAFSAAAFSEGFVRMIVCVVRFSSSMKNVYQTD